MDFNLTDEQELIVASYRDYMESENWETYFHECDEKHEYPLRWAQGLCEMGFDRIMLDEEHGGLGLEQPITTLRFSASTVPRPMFCTCSPVTTPSSARALRSRSMLA